MIAEASADAPKLSQLYRTICGTILAAAVAIASNAALAGGTVFENWSEKTASVNISEDGRKGWIKALPANGEKKGRFLGMLGCKLSDLSKAKVGFREGRLVVDTTECDLSQPRRSSASSS